MSLCPECGYEAANMEEEVAHMSTEHPEVVSERLRNAGFVQNENGIWVDVRKWDTSGPDWPD